MDNLDLNPPLAVTVDAAADMLAVSRRTVYRLAQAGKLRIVRVTADAPRVLCADLRTFLATIAMEGNLK